MFLILCFCLAASKTSSNGCSICTRPKVERIVVSRHFTFKTRGYRLIPGQCFFFHVKKNKHITLSNVPTTGSW